MSEVDGPDAAPAAPQAKAKALEVLLGRRVWRAPLLIGSVFVALIVTVYLGSVIAAEAVADAV